MSRSALRAVHVFVPEGLAPLEIHLPTVRTHLTTEKTDLSTEKTNLTTEKTNLSTEKTNLSTEKAYLFMEETYLSVVVRGVSVVRRCVRVVHALRSRVEGVRIRCVGTACRLVRIRKRFGATPALQEFSLDVREGELLAILGPSGSGKTTALRVIAGIETPDAGEVWLGDRLASDTRIRVRPEDRGLGMVFQGLALWGHMTARGHLEFCLRGRGVPRAERAARVQEAVSRARLDAPLDRLPHQLSEGQAQRLAIARALVTRPRLVLFDEPLANLDAPLKADLLAELRALPCSAGAALVHVTHDQHEALSIADRIAVVRAGRVEQVGTPTEVYERPRTAFVAGFVGQGSLLAARVESGRAVTCLGAVDVGPLNGWTQLRVCVRPEAVEEDASGVPAEVLGGDFLGDGWTWRLSVAGTPVVMRGREAPRPGARVRIVARRGAAVPSEE